MEQQKDRRSIASNRTKFEGKTPAQIRAMYRKDYPDAKGMKTCSRVDGCLHPNGPSLPAEEFNISRGNESGLQNQCKACSKSRV
jgi:hypothetical protein